MSNHDPYSDSPEPVGWIQHHQLYSSGGADIVMESITLIEAVVRLAALYIAQKPSAACQCSPTAHPESSDMLRTDAERRNRETVELILSFLR
jgi:hypothetical protein